MISLKQCQAYLNECEALAADAKLSVRRATAVIAVCHAWLALSDAVRKYETIAGRKMLPKRLRDSLRVVCVRARWDSFHQNVWTARAESLRVHRQRKEWSR